MQAIKELRRNARLSQRKLAKKAGVAYKTLQRLEAGLDVRWSTLSKLADALGAPSPAAIAQAAPRPTAAETARRMAASPDAWKNELFDFVDEFHAKPADGLAEAPPAVRLDPRRMALLASTVEALCAGAGIPAPWWCDGAPGLEEPWFPADAESLKASALVESPVWFRRRNIFVLDNFLSRA